MASSEGIMILLNALRLIPLAIILYAACWAFDIRHALAVRVYKNQALGVGLLSIFFVYLLFLNTGGAAQGPYAPLIGLLELLFGLTGFLGVMYFVDASVLASRRSDPLFRDTLHWSIVRYVVWTYEIFSASFTGLGTALSMIGGTSASLLQVVSFGFSISFPLVFLVPIFSFLILIPVAIRARDPYLRGHFEWLGLMAGSTLLLQISGAIPSSDFTVLVGIILTSIGGYCLYKSARSLVPLNRTPRLEKEFTTEAPPP
jgi:hypothetical protein